MLPRFIITKAPLGVAMLLLVLMFLLPAISQAQQKGQSLDNPFDLATPGTSATGQRIPGASIQKLANAIFGFGIVAVILAAAIYIAIGAYLYFVAAGNAKMAETGKTYITRSIMGLIVALLAWVILNTISSQFTSERHSFQTNPKAPRGTNPQLPDLEN